MTFDQVLNILCKKSYMVDKSNDDNIIPLYGSSDAESTYSIETTKDFAYIIMDCDIKDGPPDIYKVTEDYLYTNIESMGVIVEKVIDPKELNTIYSHIDTFKKESKS